MYVTYFSCCAGNVPAWPGGDHRRGLYDQDRGGGGGEDQAPDLGHSRAGEVSTSRL